MIYRISGSITSNTKVVLVNVIHFKSEWKEKFQDSFEAPFRLANGQEKQVQMMYGTMRQLGYTKIGDFEVVKFDFSDGEHSMVVFLPKEGKGNLKYIGLWTFRAQI